MRERTSKSLKLHHLICVSAVIIQIHVATTRVSIEYFHPFISNIDVHFRTHYLHLCKWESVEYRKDSSKFITHQNLFLKVARFTTAKATSTINSVLFDKRSYIERPKHVLKLHTTTTSRYRASPIVSLASPKATCD